MTNGAIILAGGKGERFHGQKQFYELQGKPLWQHVFEKTAQVLGTEDNIVKVGIDIPGGSTRTESVISGLRLLNEKTDKVLIVEAARPLVTKEQLQQLLDDPSESVTFVIPLVNTIIGKDGTYYDRSNFYDLLTPQAFDYQKLYSAYKTNKYKNMTDETRVMFEEYGIKPKFIETGDNLLKVTYPRDIAIINELIKGQGGLV